MKKTSLIVLLSCGLVAAGVSAEARTTKRTTNNTTTEHIESHQAAASHSSSDTTFDLGISSISPVPVVAGGTSGSLTGLIHFNTLDTLQLLLGISGTNGGFGFGVGGIYKRTLLGNESAGLHLGGGIGLGTVAGAGGGAGSSTSFAMNIVAVVGAHFEIPGTQLAFHFDGGPTFSLVSISGVNGIGGQTVTSFAIMPLSPLLGASVVYQF